MNLNSHCAELRADTIADTTRRITARSAHYGMHDAINKSLCRRIVKYDIRSYNRTIHRKIGKFTLKSEALAGLAFFSFRQNRNHVDLIALKLTEARLSAKTETLVSDISCCYECTELIMCTTRHCKKIQTVGTCTGLNVSTFIHKNSCTND